MPFHLSKARQRANWKTTTTTCALLRTDALYCVCVCAYEFFFLLANLKFDKSCKMKKKINKTTKIKFFLKREDWAIEKLTIFIAPILNYFFNSKIKKDSLERKNN